MKAVFISRAGGPEVLEIREVADPQPDPGELLVNVAAAALNRADLLQRKGLYPAPKDAPPDIPGLEFSGTVATGIGPFQAGDRVMGLLSGGGYAEKVVIPQSLAIPVPDEWSDEEAGAFPEAYFTAYDALYPQLGLKMGERVLIHAVGSGVGLAALQLAKCGGATVIGTAGTQEKLSKAERFGLDLGIDYRYQNFHEEIHRFTEGRGVDAVLDLIGARYWDHNIESLAPGGRMILVGLLGGREVQVDLSRLLRKRLTIHGTVLRGRSLWDKKILTDQIKRHVLPLAASGRIRPVIDSVFDIDDVAQAQRRMENNLNFGKIVLRMT